MFEILTAAEMKTTDAQTIESGTPGFTLMQAAGLAVAQKIMDSATPCPVLILNGPGNNGGDGFVIAHTLKEKGWNVRVACTVKTPQLKGDAAKAAKQWDGPVEALNSNLAVKDAGLVVDAVFGTGFSGALPPETVTFFDKVRTKNLPVIAVDIPSGIDATAATVAEGTLHANASITFCRKKIAHTLQPTKDFCGAIHVAHIGIADETVAALNTQLFENDPALWLANFPLPAPNKHKYDRGHVGVLGGKQRTGAACLAAAAAQKAGAGVVTLAAPETAALVYQTYRASLMTDIWHDADSLKAIFRDPRKNTLVIGPGAGLDTQDAVEAALSFSKPAVIDGDVFTLYKDRPQDLFAHLSDKQVLTPHEGEFARLFPGITGHKVDRAREAAVKSGSIILLKGAETVIAAPDGTAIINTRAPATLATAGSGDVLAGLIAGLIAQNMPPFMAAAAGVWLHAKSASIYGIGLTAEDIISHTNQALKHLFSAPQENA
ncbi:MAG: NAD(P)H-hydrate dehydratase [Alphaproteobacteria bacterium]|nr:NAD(P)H-hydrate dehydratase [Alphaproteobacteria bacterium]